MTRRRRPRRPATARPPRRPAVVLPGVAATDTPRRHRTPPRARAIASHGTRPSSGRAAARAPAATDGDSRPFDLRVSENVEAIAISIAMALVLKFFIIEAYQIPTGSMQPTILGDAETGIKDRILADKLITMLRPPNRWEVMIFRFPLDERRLYVKRIVGLPGETLEVLGGDIWVDGAIARKPDHVNESVLKTIAEGGGPMDVGRWFQSSGDVQVDGREAVFGGAPGARLRLRGHVMDDYLHGYDPDWGIPPKPGGDHAVADLDLTLHAHVDEATDALRLVFEADEGETSFVLPRTGSGETAHVLLPTAAGERRLEVPGDRALPVGESEVVARVVDRQLLLVVDGEEWFRFDDDEAGPHRDTPRRARLAVEMPGGGRVSDLVVRRDIFYLPTTRGSFGASPDARWEIPDDAYFGMGDNTQYSHDSRSWTSITYDLADGRSLTGFNFSHPYRQQPADANPYVLPDGTWRFADVHGDSAVFHPTQVRGKEIEPAPFIHERYLLGKAGVVFWPVFDPFRWKLVR